MKKLAFFLFLGLTLSGSAFAAEKAGKPGESKHPSQMTSEQRQKMADLHEKMAACLRSNRPMSDCRQEMMRSCREQMGESGCPMMGGTMGHDMHHHMMGHPSGDTESQTAE